MLSKIFFASLDFFMPPSQVGGPRDELTKSRIFVLGNLLSVLVTIIDLGRLATAQKPGIIIGETLNLLMVIVSLVLHSLYARPRYLVLPFALGIAATLTFTIILPNPSLLAPSILWLPLIAGLVFFISGPRWGLLFAATMLLLTCAIQIHKRDQLMSPLPGLDHRAFIASLVIVLFQVTATVAVMIHFYIRLHREAQEDMLTVQNQAAQMIRSTENTDFSHNLHFQITEKLKPLRDELADFRALPPDMCLRMGYDFQKALTDLKHYAAIFR